jgi:hypothetical protein
MIYTLPILVSSLRDAGSFRSSTTALERVFGRWSTTASFNTRLSVD